MKTVNHEDGRFFLDPHPELAVGSQRHNSRDSGTVVARRETSQISVPLQVVSSTSSNISPPVCETLDLIARARQDLTAPLPPQFSSQQTHGRYTPQPRAQPGSLRCTSQAPCLDAARAGSGHALGRSSDSASCPSAEASLGMMQQERRQLLEWGDSLFQQVAHLEQENARLEKSAAAAAVASTAARRYLEEDVEQLKHWGAELERQLKASGTGAKTNEEALRKQLAAYAVEIDSLRDDNEKIERFRREAQESVQRLSIEREELHAQLESIKFNEEALEDLRQQHQEALSKLENGARDCSNMKDQDAKAQTSLEQLNAAIAQEREQSSSLACVIKSLQDSYAKLQGGFVAQTTEFGQFVERSKEQLQQAQEHLEGVRREVGAQAKMIESLRSELTETQQRHIESCQRWQELTRHKSCEAQVGATEAVEERLKELQYNFGVEREVMEERLGSESALRRKFEEEIGRRDQLQLERNSKRQCRLGMDRALVRLERALERNIARDMFELHQGAVLEKVHERNCRREARLVVVSADEMHMRWSKQQRGCKPGRSPQSRLDLYEVIRIHYGSMARASVLHQEVPPWLCFALHTPRRSYDFCCPDEETVQRFVLGLSRLCDWASGTIATRSRFVALRGWCKLEDHCFHEQISLGRLFLDALDRIREAPRQMDKPHSPSPLPPV